MIRLDMSEFMEKHSASKLIGPPPGYVGYDEGGQLTEKLRRRPYSVVLFDEIEKSHEDVFNILLQILDEGRLTDAQGRQADFKNSIIVMTSNVGARSITDEARRLGFSHGQDPGGLRRDAEIRKQVMADLRRTFRPEFLNRVDDSIVFRRLTREDIRAIAGNMLSAVAKRMDGLGVALEYSAAAVEALAEAGFDPAYGARPLRRTIRNAIEDAAAEKLLDGSLAPGDTACADVEDGKITLRKKQSENAA